MAFSKHWVTRDEPELAAAFAEAQQAIGEAFAQAVGRFGYPLKEPYDGKNPHESISRWIEWWVGSISDPFDSLSCELWLLCTDEGPEISGKVAIWKYLGRGCSDDTPLWQAQEQIVESPAQAAAVIRQTSAELVRQLGLIDLRPYLKDPVGEIPESADTSTK
jgi:hypothetical protein